MQPPQEPYNPNNPPPPYGQSPYGQQAYVPQPVYGPPPPLPPRGTVSLDVISEAFNLLKPNLGPWALAVVAYYGIPYAFGMVRQVVELVGRSTNSYVGVALGILIQIASFVASAVLFAGVTKFAVQTVRDRLSNINSMWSVKDIWGKVILFGILRGLLYTVLSLPGLFVLGTSIFVPLYRAGLLNPALWTGSKPPPISPSLIGGMVGGAALGTLLIYLFVLPLSVLLLLSYPLLVDRNVGPWQAITQSAGALKKHFWQALLLNIVLGLVNVLGLMVCCVGALFTFALTQIAVAIVYRDIFGMEEGSAPTGTVYAPPPIANPNF